MLFRVKKEILSCIVFIISTLLLFYIVMKINRVDVEDPVLKNRTLRNFLSMNVKDSTKVISFSYPVDTIISRKYFTSESVFARGNGILRFDGVNFNQGLTVDVSKSYYNFVNSELKYLDFIDDLKKMDSVSTRGRRVDFLNCVLRDLVDFTYVPQFHEIHMFRCHINDRVVFSQHFMDDVQYERDSLSHIKNKVNKINHFLVNNTEIRGDLELGFSYFEKFEIYNSSFYKNEWRISNTQFKNAPIIENCQLPKRIIFRDVETSNWGKFDLTTSRCILPGEKTTLEFNYIFRHLDASNFLIPSDKFDIIFGERVPVRKQLIVLEQIKTKCKNEGLIDSFVDWDIKYNKLTNVENWSWFGYIINIIQMCWWNFGYSKWLIVILWMPFSFTIFWLASFYNLQYIIDNVYYDPELGRNYIIDIKYDGKLSKREIQRRNIDIILNNKLAYTFFFTAVIYFGFKIRHDAVNYQNFKGMIFIYALYLTGTFHVAYAIGYLLN